MFPAGIVTACPSNGRLRKTTARRARTRTKSRLSSFGKNAVISPPTGSVSSQRNFSVSVLWVTGMTRTSMKYESEAIIAAEIGKFLMNGSLFRGTKPVMWSAVEKTALAEAEIEYFDRTSTTIYARFPVVRTSHAALEGATVVIWTTTPWTMPGNRATAYGEDINYGIWKVTSVDDGSLARVDERLVVADALAETVAEACGINGFERETSVPASAFADTVLHHPLHGKGYDHEVPMLPADYVTTEQGTGIVHIAPGHGAEDYLLGIAHGVPVPETISATGG